MRWITILLLAPAFASEASSARSLSGPYDQPCLALPPNPTLAHDFGGLCRYEQANAQLPPATDQRVLYLGDSITESWGSGIVGLTPDDLVNRGISGQTTAQMLVRFRADVLKLRPRIVHLLAGTNDLAGNTGPTSVGRIKDALISMCEQARAHGIRVVLGSILPVESYPWNPSVKPTPHIRELNQWMKAYALEHGHAFADYYMALADSEGRFLKAFTNDGVHPNAAGYARMAEIAAPAIRGATEGGKGAKRPQP